MDRRIVAIAGKAPLTCEMVNLEPDNVEVWGLADAYKHITRRIDRWFEIHTPDADGYYRGFTPWVPGGPEAHLGWLWDCSVPVYMNAVDPHVPTSVVFPYHKIGSHYRHYFTGTVAYMLALAALEEVDEIHLWGVEMAGGTEYEDQRPCTEYWLGVLETQGCRVFIPDSSPLLKPVGGTYGLTTRKHLSAAAILDEISRFDLETAQRGNTPERQGGRTALLSLLNKADSATRGMIVEPALTVFGDNEEALKNKAASVREAILNPK